MRTQSPKKAFTLIELLVVISIISLLVAILLPALQSSRVTAQMTQSAVNARQLYMFVQYYANDYNQSSPYVTFPVGFNTSPYFYSGRYSGYTFNWASVLWDARYVDDYQVFWGPARDMSARYSVGHFPLGDRFGTVNPGLVASMMSRILPPAANSAYTGQAGLYWPMVGYGMVSDASVTPAFANVRNVDRAIRLKLDRVICMAESWNNIAQAPVLPAAGYYTVVPGGDPTFVPGGARSLNSRLFNHRGSVVRSYWDGHVIAGESRSIGWDTTATNNTYFGDPYGGAWTYSSSNPLGFAQWRSRAPWYTQWETAGVQD